MKKSVMILMVVLFFFLGCAKIEQSDERFYIVSVALLDVAHMSDGRIDILLRPTFEYSNSSQEKVVIMESWNINGELVRVNDYDTLTSTAGAVVTKEAKYAIRHVLPKGSTEVVLSGEFIATYYFGNIISQLKQVNLPVVL